MIELKEIKRRRKNLNLTQNELAKLADVSQSALAKIEAGRMNPSFEIATKIFNSLEEQEHKIATKAFDIMTKKVLTIDADAHVEKAIALMKKYGISQLPVLKKGNLVGLFSETVLLENIEKKNLGVKKVAEVMADAPPQIPETTPVKSISELLKHSPIVLVLKQAKIQGVITKADLLKVVK